jgi:hypothetical protein
MGKLGIRRRRFGGGGGKKGRKALALRAYLCHNRKHIPLKN